MSGAWIMIWVILSNVGAVATGMAEYSSEEKCMKAVASLQGGMESVAPQDQKFIFVAGCSEK